MISVKIDKSQTIAAVKKTLLESTGVSAELTGADGSALPGDATLEAVSGRSYIQSEILLFESALLKDLASKFRDTLGIGLVALDGEGNPADEKLSINDYRKMVSVSRPAAAEPQVVPLSASSPAAKAPDEGEAAIREMMDKAYSYRDLLSVAEKAARSAMYSIAVEAYGKAFTKIFIFSDYRPFFNSIASSMKDFSFVGSLIEEAEKKAFLNSDKELIEVYKNKFCSPGKGAGEAVPAAVAEKEIAVSAVIPDTSEIPSVEPPVEEALPPVEEALPPAENLFADSVPVPAEEAVPAQEEVDEVEESAIEELFCDEAPVAAETTMDRPEQPAAVEPEPVKASPPPQAAAPVTPSSFEELRHKAAAYHEFESDVEKARLLYLEAEKAATGFHEYLKLSKTILLSLDDVEMASRLLKKAQGAAKNMDELIELAGYILLDYSDKEWAGQVCRKAAEFAYGSMERKKLGDFVLKELNDVRFAEKLYTGK